jgi:16S rRNA (adenine1518-N6/adenine1519-N6)-dimethyltransferase
MQDDIKSFLKKYNFEPNHLLGQNFLIDDSVLDEIISAADLKKTDEVLEIGAGIGNLTKLLAEKSKFVLAIEKDKRFFPILANQLGAHLQHHTKTPSRSANVELIFADATTYNFQKILSKNYKAIANIPYYITGKIIEMLLTAKNKPQKIILLVQKEVAERIVAKPGQLSILAISVQLFCNAKIAGLVPKEKFYPIPKVDSAILVLDWLPEPRFDVDEKKFFSIVKAAFAGKRKQIHNTLKNNTQLNAAKLKEIFDLGILDPKARPQELTMQQWHALYTQIYGE